MCSSDLPFPLRIAGARYAAWVPEAVDSDIDQSAQGRAEAELYIQHGLARNPESATWLDLRGRAELLDHDADAAIDALEDAQERAPANPEILADLGAAYSLRAEVAHHPADYARALEAFGRSFQIREQAAVLYNLALTCERLRLYNDAAELWVRYLGMRDSGDWAIEASSHLRQVLKKK